MSTSPVINALIEKRAELAGYLADLERRAVQCRADLVHLDSTLRMFNPEFDPDSIMPKQPQRRSLYFQMGEVAQRCREAIRKAGGQPISADEIAISAIRDKGLDPQDKKLRALFTRRFLWALNRMAKRGEIGKAGDGRNVRWLAK